ncbi:MAG TPA: VOC family protein [Bryobacteraceae bacterium]|nr:VOC family protein [Bryobacteraceae bacterium]
MRITKSVAIIAAACGLMLAGTSDAPGPATGVRAIIHSVADLDKTVAFYRDGLSLPLVGNDGKPATALPSPQVLDEDLSKFTDTHGAKFRNASFNIPGAAFMLELTEFTSTARKQAVPHMQDPGAATLVLNVRDVNKALAGVKSHGGSVMTVGGQPMRLGGETSQNWSVFVRDPDGFMLELASTNPIPKTSAPADSNIVGGRIGETIKNTEQTMTFYHDVLGFETKPAAADYQTNPTITSLIDAKGAHWRISRANVPGSDVSFELLEFKDVPRKEFALRVPDIGAPAVSVHVKDVESTMKAVAAGGGSIVTRGGEPVKLGPAKGVFVRDPNGLLIELIP